MRLVVPWKYGFKSAKSLVRIRLHRPRAARPAWNKAAANEYGFYSNVNPNVDHPRWSQATERRIGEFRRRARRCMFNGYDQVASLYTGMDLKKSLLGPRRAKGASWPESRVSGRARRGTSTSSGFSPPRRSTGAAPLLNHLVYARRPSIFRGARGMWTGMDASGLIDGELTALINRRVASLNGCEF